MKSPNQSHFSQVPQATIRRSSFDRSHGYKTTFDAGYLIPFYVDEALPGDSFKLNATLFARLATPLKPIMDNMRITSFFFSVPNRLIWDNWQRFQGEQDNPTDSIDYLVPKLSGANAISPGTVADYMGIPPGTIPDTVTISALPFRAMHLIWNTWFRDQNLQDSVTVPKGDAADGISQYQLLRRGKRHDYFTSCLPTPQKGEGVTVPLGGTIPVDGSIYVVPFENNAPVFQSVLNSGVTVEGVLYHSTGSSQVNVSNGVAANLNELTWDTTNLATTHDLTGDLSTATVVTINALREAFAIQRILEKDIRSGSRYIEIVKSHFGVTSPDLRATRPEYLGGSSTPINVTAVPSTYGSETSPQANLAGVGVGSGSGHGFTKSFTEHCTIIGFISVNADLTYQQGLNRMWSRQTRFDFYMPAFQALGEQPVLNKEIYVSNDPAIDDAVFGYNEAFADYRYKPSLVTGKFRSSDPETLDVWHLAQNFADLPALNSEFIEDNPPIARIIAVPSEPHFILDSYLDLKTARPMPTYAIPGMIDHF